MNQLSNLRNSFAVTMIAVALHLLLSGRLLAENLGLNADDEITQEMPKGEVVLVLRDEVDFKSEPLTLAQVVECSGDEIYCQDAKGIDLSKKATPGKNFVIPAEAIRTVVAAEWPKATVKLVGKPVVKVRCPSIAVTNDEIMEMVSKGIDERVKGAKDIRVTVDKVQMTAPLMVLEEDHQIIFPILQDYADKPVTDLLRSLVTNPTIAGAYQSSRGTARFFVQISIRVEEMVNVARSFASAGTPVEASNFSRQWYSWPTIRGQSAFATSIEPYLGLLLKRGVPAGEPLFIDSVSRPFAIQRGQVIKVFSRFAALDVSIRGTAQTSGSVGQAIEIELNSTKKRVTAKIVDSSSAEMIR